MSTVNDVYRTNDGQGYFEFNFVKVRNLYEVDIVSTPSYGSRSTDLHSTHRLNSERGGYKICFGDPSVVTSLDKAMKYVENWCEGTWQDIKTGRTFG